MLSCPGISSLQETFLCPTAERERTQRTIAPPAGGVNGRPSR